MDKNTQRLNFQLNEEGGGAEGFKFELTCLLCGTGLGGAGPFFRFHCPKVLLSRGREGSSLSRLRIKHNNSIKIPYIKIHTYFEPI